MKGLCETLDTHFAKFYSGDFCSCQEMVTKESFIKLIFKSTFKILMPKFLQQQKIHYVLIYFCYKIYCVLVEIFCCYYSLSEIGQLISVGQRLHPKQKVVSSHTTANLPELKLSPIAKLTVTFFRSKIVLKSSD